MACKEQHQDVVLHLLIGERVSMLLICICQKAREDVFMSSDQANAHIPLLLDPYLQLLSYHIRSCEGFAIYIVPRMLIGS